MLLALVLLALLLAGIGYREAVADPELRRLRIRIAGWPSAAPPMRVVLLSDIHLGGGMMDARRLRRIVGQVNAVHPDLVLMAGDFIVGHDAGGAAERAAGLTAPLSGLRARLGSIAVLGNHDHWTAPAAVRTALARAGVVVLDNAAKRVGPIAILGVDDDYSGHADIARTMAAWQRIGGIPILLSHPPDPVWRLPPGLPLLLAGHTHCGQVVIPGWGPLLRLSPREQWRPLYDPRLRCGLIRLGDRTVIVTAGLGSGTMPLRLGAPPDWWLIELDGVTG
jgi:hypothetical protein